MYFPNIILHIQMQSSKKLAHDAQLAATTCSPSPPPVTPSTSPAYKHDKKGSPTKGKKRVGHYYYNLNHLIGSGYQGKVYKGFRQDDKSTPYAIKVIKTKNMKAASTLLLSNQVSLLQELNHQNIVSLIQVLYSANHCYLVTEYCEGGNLEQYYKNKKELEWGSIIHQISQGCKYLSERGIIHRDLKPDNIFLKNGVWKIGDFGFARKLQKIDMLLIESYRVGSPLYMPLETLQRGMYSIKSDSFALGVIMYNLIFKEFPYNGKNMNELLQCQQEKQIIFSPQEFLSEEIIEIIKGLCHADHRERLTISKVDFKVFLQHKTLQQIDYFLISQIEGKIPQQIILCQFINYFMRNCINFLQGDHPLYSLISSQLYHLTSVFNWQRYNFLVSMKQCYILPLGEVDLNETLYQKILLLLRQELFTLNRQDEANNVAAMKIIEYFQLTECILRGIGSQLLEMLRGIELHQSFDQLTVSLEIVEQKLISLGL